MSDGVRIASVLPGFCLATYLRNRVGELPVLSDPVLRVVDLDELVDELLLRLAKVSVPSLLRSEDRMVVQRIVHYRVSCRTRASDSNIQDFNRFRLFDTV